MVDEGIPRILSNPSCMMKKRKIMMLAGLFLFILTSIRFVWIAYHKTPDHPHAVQGILDLSKWDFALNRSITLDGEWEFYPNSLLVDHPLTIDEAYRKQRSERSYIQVPSDWSSLLSPQDHRTNGYASYRLRIRIDAERQQSYALRMAGIVSASAVYVDGKRIGHSGQPAIAEEHYISRNVPYTVSFTTENDEIDLVVHVANYDDTLKGGILESIKFGSEAAVNSEQTISTNMQWLMCFFLLIHIIYGIVLYVVGLREKSLVYLWLAACFAIMITLVDDHRLLFHFLPFHYEWFIRLFQWSYLGVALFLMLGLREILPKYATGRFVRYFIWVITFYAIFVLIVPAKYSVWAIPAFYVVYTLLFLYIPVVTFRTVMNNYEDALSLAFVATAFSTNVIWGLMKNAGLIENVYYPIDFFAAFIAFAVFWFRQYLRTVQQTKNDAIKLQQADKMKDEFLANTSHELRTPLHGVINIAQNVLEEERGSLRSENVQNLEMLISVGKRMSFIINDLLDFTQLREGRVLLKLEQVRVQSLASGVLDMLRFMIKGRPIQLIMAIPDSFPPVQADEKRLVQILFNLVHNAIKFTDEGTVAVRAEIHQEMAYIYVEDTGVGMDEELQRRVFRAYEQGDVNRIASVGGIGLGLNICKHMVELHGGSLFVQSTVGEGSVFSITLPLSRAMDVQEDNRLVSPHVAASMPNEQMDDSSGSISLRHQMHHKLKRQILIVDDDNVNLKVLADMLPAAQYVVDTAWSGSEAIAMLDKKQWDLIIADVMMPMMSGYEMTTLVRKRYSLSELPILLLTARSNPEDIHSGFMAGANDYVTKPVDALELRSRVQALTDLKQSVHDRLRMEAAYLQAQIKPHFLFNALNSITALSTIDLDKMNGMIDAFSLYLRYSFDLLNAEKFVSIEHELELVRSYLYIEQVRFPDRLEVVWDVEFSTEVLLPPLTIQPLVENAVRHGLMKRAQGGVIRIVIREDAQALHINILDNGVGMDKELAAQLLDGDGDAQKGIGLSNTDRRLKQLYGKGLRIDSALHQGTTVSFSIITE